jgi:hypothetical protein
MAEKPESQRESRDERIEHSTHSHREAHIAIHTDTYDIDEDALGTNLPKHYYMSPGFIGTVTVRSAQTLQRMR